MSERVGVINRARNATSLVAHRAIGIGPIRDPETREQLKVQRRATDNAVAAPFAQGKPIEGIKAYQKHRGARAAVFFMIAGAITIPAAADAQLDGALGRFAASIADKIVPERLEPSNYCHTGGGLLGVINFDYESDDNSAPGDCDYEATGNVAADNNSESAGQDAVEPKDGDSGANNDRSPAPSTGGSLDTVAPSANGDVCVAVPFELTTDSATIWSATDYFNEGSPAEALRNGWEAVNPGGPSYAQLMAGELALGTYNLPDCD